MEQQCLPLPLSVCPENPDNHCIQSSSFLLCPQADFKPASFNSSELVSLSPMTIPDHSPLLSCFSLGLDEVKVTEYYVNMDTEMRDMR